MSRQGGKLKPLKVRLPSLAASAHAHIHPILSSSPRRQAPKKDKKDIDEEDLAFKEKQKADAAALKAAQAKGKRTPPSVSAPLPPLTEPDMRFAHTQPRRVSVARVPSSTRARPLLSCSLSSSI